MKKPLEGKVAVVAGATRGTGRGIALALGEAGATVYCTGRSSRAEKRAPKKRKGRGVFSLNDRPETIEETAEMVTARGGKGIAVRVDHSIPAEVEALFKRVKRVDILANDIWGGDELTEWKAFGKHSIEKGLLMLRRGIDTHIITAHFAVPRMTKQKSGLIVEVTDGDHYGYRGTFYYDLVKTTVIRLAFNYARELKKHGVSAVAVTPGFIRSEAMLEYMGVTEANWQEGARKRPEWIESESPLFVGRAVAALASDPNVSQKSGRVYASWDLADEYGFSDADGRRPHFRRWVEKNLGMQWKSCDDGFYAYCNSF